MKKKFAKKIISHSFETKNEGMQNKSAPSSLEQIQNMHRLDERALWKMNTSKDYKISLIYKISSTLYTLL